MIAVVTATVLAIAVSCGSWLVDQRLLKCKTKVRAVLATMGLLAGTWVCFLIKALFFFQVPGAYGPVQYWHGVTHMSMTDIRLFAFLLTMCGILISIATLLATLFAGQ